VLHLTLMSFETQNTFEQIALEETAMPTIAVLQQRVAQLERQLDFQQSNAAVADQQDQSDTSRNKGGDGKAERALLRQIALLSRTMSMLMERDRLLQAFQRIGQTILTHLDRDRILAVLAEQLVQTEVLDSFSISLLEQRGDQLEVIQCQKADGTCQSVTAPAPEALRNATLQSGVHCITGPDKSMVYYLPIRKGDKPLAVLEVHGSQAEHPTTLQRLAFMDPLLDLIAVALEHARLYRQAQTRNRQLIRLERQRALGEMALGVSHNLNNMLAAVLVPAQFLQRGNADPEQVRREADEIVNAGRRAADLVRRLYRSVQPRDNDNLEAIDLNEIIPQVIEATRDRWQEVPRQNGKVIRLETALEPLEAVQAVGLELHGILADLILNAVDALPKGGKITLGTQKTPEGGRLWVRDDGIGMDEEIRRRVFEPFFTTKDDVGPGLGLSTAYNAITYWGGQLEVESQPGEGSTFTIDLPFAPAVPNSIPSPATSTSTSGRLLIVEDDPTISDVLDNVLSETHQVTTVPNGQDAITHFKASAYDAVLIELDLEGMSGGQVAAALRTLAPHTATVLVLDWPLAAGDSRASLFDYTVEKPFDDLDLLEDTVIRAVELSRQRASR
jgi:signal transduction histidine kinase/CheY-like chemotaxis protein